MRQGRGTRGVFLDRDGVINNVDVRNGKPYPPRSTDSMKILPGVPETLEALSSVGLWTIVITNQPDVATGVQERRVIESMHARLQSELAIDAIYTCYHTDADSCSCRKPAPGMLLRAARDWGIDLSRSWLVGDRWRDIGAGRAVGCETFWIDRGYREPAAESPDHMVGSLAEAGQLILEMFPEHGRGILKRER